MQACSAYIEAVDHLTAQFSGYVVTDIRMPGKSGFDLIAKCHAIDPNLPVIAITGFAETETVVKSMQGGALTVLEKPCEMETLLRAINDALHARRTIIKTHKSRSKRVARHSRGRPPTDRALSAQMGDYERELITRALKRNDGHKQKAAAELGISKSQFYAKLKTFGLS